MEENRRRLEASMRRKHNQAPNIINGGTGGGDELVSSSPISTGAMDSLLEKLRAAAPQARDQRDRRRRARLKERHQVRVASGQQMPELGDVAGPNSPDQEVDDSTDFSVGDAKQPLDGEDVADRAASLLQGLRRDGEADGDGKADKVDISSRPNSIRIQRRRESADDERRARRTRRGVGIRDGSRNTMIEVTKAEAGSMDEGLGGGEEEEKGEAGGQVEEAEVDKGKPVTTNDVTRESS